MTSQEKMYKAFPIILVLAISVIGVVILASHNRVTPPDDVLAPIDEKPVVEYLPAANEPSVTDTLSTISDAIIPSGPPSQFLIVGVPYIHETPDGVWTGPWKNACEEASIAMVEFFYNGQSSVTKDEAKQRMIELFDIEDGLWGQNANSDAAQTAELINNSTSFTAVVVENPTIDAIKTELLAGRPVISLHNGFELDNRNIPFLPTGSGYHMMVVIGYNDVTGAFIVQDDGDLETGEEHRYRYSLFMNSLNDYNAATQKTDGPARVLFTAPKSIEI